jgi:hypothetical protein
MVASCKDILVIANIGFGFLGLKCISQNVFIVVTFSPLSVTKIDGSLGDKFS